MTDIPGDNTAEVDVQALVSRWADETGRLFKVLPRYLTECEGLKVELLQLQQQVTELKQENEKLQQSRAALADLFVRFREIVEGSTSENGVNEKRAQGQAEPLVTAVPTGGDGVRLSSIFSRVGHKP